VNSKRKAIHRAIGTAAVMAAALFGWACGSAGRSGPDGKASPAGTATPGPLQEWTLEGVHVEGSTVTVVLRVFAGVDVSATLDGAEPDTTSATGPTLEFAFFDVAAGEHQLTVRDVVGFEERRTVTVTSGPARVRPGTGSTASRGR